MTSEWFTLRKKLLYADACRKIGTHLKLKLKNIRLKYLVKQLNVVLRDVLMLPTFSPSPSMTLSMAEPSTPLRKTLTALSMFALLAVGSASLELEGALHVMVKGRSESMH